MPAYDLNQGENALLTFNLFDTEDTDEFQGDWNGIDAYVINDVVVHDSIGYRCILGHTNQEPPNATYWEVLTNTEADDVKEARVDLFQDGESVLNWKYKFGVPSPSNVKLVDGLFQVELTKAQSLILSGVHDVKLELTVKDSDFIASGAQTNATCVEDAINVIPC